MFYLTFFNMRLFSLAAGVSLICTVASITLPKEYALKASSNGRYFVTGKGEPFFWQADTSWTLFHRFTYQEAELYLNDRVAKGYTVIQAVGATMFGFVPAEWDQ